MKKKKKVFLVIDVENLDDTPIIDHEGQQEPTPRSPDAVYVIRGDSELEIRGDARILIKKEYRED